MQEWHRNEMSTFCIQNGEVVLPDRAFPAEP